MGASTLVQYYYSGTSHNGPSEKRTPTLQQTLAVLWIENTMAVNISNGTLPDSGQRTKSLRPPPCTK